MPSFREPHSILVVPVQETQELFNHLLAQNLPRDALRFGNCQVKREVSLARTRGRPDAALIFLVRSFPRTYPIALAPVR